MNALTSDTETVIRRHLQVFLEQRKASAIVEDYEDDACFVSEAKVYRGKPAIRGFFEQFIASLPPGAIDAFALRSLRIEGEHAYITWNAGERLPLGTDTFLVRDGKIVFQTFAMHAAG